MLQFLPREMLNGLDYWVGVEILNVRVGVEILNVRVRVVGLRWGGDFECEG